MKFSKKLEMIFLIIKNIVCKIRKKREQGTNLVIANYETIAKAAESEKIAPCTMSRAIKIKLSLKTITIFALKNPKNIFWAQFFWVAGNWMLTYRDIYDFHLKIKFEFPAAI